MSLRPARLSAGLLAPSKGDAAPATVPVARAEAPEGGELTQRPADPAIPTSVNSIAAMEPGPTPAENVRPPPPPVRRTPFSTRLSIELQEWLRTTAFVQRRGVQDIVEEAIEFYRQHHRSQ